MVVEEPQQAKTVQPRRSLDAHVVLRSGTPDGEATGVDGTAAPSSALVPSGLGREAVSTEADEETSDAAPVARQ